MDLLLCMSRRKIYCFHLFIEGINIQLGKWRIRNNRYLFPFSQFHLIYWISFFHHFDFFLLIFLFYWYSTTMRPKKVGPSAYYSWDMISFFNLIYFHSTHSSNLNYIFKYEYIILIERTIMGWVKWDGLIRSGWDLWMRLD